MLIWQIIRIRLYLNLCLTGTNRHTVSDTEKEIKCSKLFKAVHLTHVKAR